VSTWWWATAVILVTLSPLGSRAQHEAACANDRISFDYAHQAIARRAAAEVIARINRPITAGSAQTGCPSEWTWDENIDPDDEPSLGKVRRLRVVTLTGTVSYVDAGGFRQTGLFAVRLLAGPDSDAVQFVGVFYEWR